MLRTKITSAKSGQFKEFLRQSQFTGQQPMFSISKANRKVHARSCDYLYMT